MPDNNLLSLPRRALLIEDDDIDRHCIMRALRYNSTPYACDHVSCLSDVNELLNTNKYDIVITDMNLPDSTGIKTITTLLDLVGKIPLIVLSGSNDDNIALEAVHSGAQDFISKQYMNDRGLIVRTLQHAIERHQLKLSIEESRDRERFWAHYDQCTLLPNRFLFLDRLEQAITQANRDKGKFSLCFIDLDRFKDINDSIGHNAGDEVLRNVSQRMQNLIRESDTIARFGGDEFVLILYRTHRLEHLEKITEKLINAINLPIRFGRHFCSVGASIGIASYPQHGHTSELLLKHADISMYEAKNKGRNQFQLFTHELLEKKNRSFELEKNLREALRKPDDHFKLYFQPRIDLYNNRIRSVEGLIRWHNPQTQSLLHPNQFIPLAEELGVIQKIDQWVLETACKQIVAWKPVNPTIRLGVNISASTFNGNKFVSDMVQPLLKKYNIDGKNLEIEVTESILLKDTKRVHEQLIRLKQLGLTIAIDDFGTGFSSLSYLSNLPIDTLKIDGCFICDEVSERNDKAVLKAIVALGEALELKVVAECIETDAQRKYLQKLNCHEGQGFYWNKPDIDWQPQKLLSLT